MRSQTITFIKKFLETHGPFTSVLEVGSGNVNGTIKQHIPCEEYIGIDMQKMDNVNIVLNGHDLISYFGPKRFDLVICFDMLEHDDDPIATVKNMREIVRKGGYLLIGAPGRNCECHSYPSDYFRFMLPFFTEIVVAGFEDVYIDSQRDDPNHISEDEFYVWGKKV